MNAYENASRSGNATSSDPITRTAYASAVPQRHFFWRPLTDTRSARPVRSCVRVDCGRRVHSRSLVMHAALEHAELHERQGEHEGEQDDRLSARVSELEVLERVEVDAVHERARRVHRSASRHQVDLRDRLQDRDRIDDDEPET